MTDPSREVNRIKGFKKGAADTNAEPVYLGKYMLFSDQDLTSLKHNLLGQMLVSTVFVGLLHYLSDERIPLLIRMVMAALIITGLHSVTIAIWNLLVSHVQIHPGHHPKMLWTKLNGHPFYAVLLGIAITLAAATWVNGSHPQDQVTQVMSVFMVEKKP